MKTYTFANLKAEEADDQRTIIISEEITVPETTTTKEERITIAQLKEKYSQNISTIERLQQESPDILAQIKEISEKLNLEVVLPADELVEKE